MGVHQMAMKIILEDDSGKQEKIVMNVEIQDKAWEKDCYQQGCMVAKALAKENGKDLYAAIRIAQNCMNRMAPPSGTLEFPFETTCKQFIQIMLMPA